MRLVELIERYIGYRQGLGERFYTNANHLRAFGRAVGTRAAVTAVRPEQVEAFLTGAGPVTSAWHSKHNALTGFYRYALARGYVTASPLPTVQPKRPPAFVPYIYSHEEVRRLLQAAESFRSRCTRLEPITARTMILLLYGTGLRVREAINLNRADVDLADAVLTVRHTKFYKSRLVPIAGQLRDVLAQYAAGRPPAVNEPEGTASFFSMRSGARVSQAALEHRFQRLRERANVCRSDGARYQPRLHDLRHTFAVHRLTSWYRQGADVQRFLPQLSVYLGHVYLCSTQVYLSMTPELLQEAGARFENYAQGEEHDGR
jgi:site-specific recombinase XerD